ncbi:M23 family metallopeptidase, partial [uncultured Roseovarius sp.]|uniref:M23 family metallopeptidase n=1 Tax=uncultured Roseovarius sp. TaxID=293344 RepID=UPI00262E10A6
MKIRIVLASAVVAGAFLITAIAISGVLFKEPVPPAIAEATLWTPDPLSMPQIPETNSVRSLFVQADGAFEFRSAPLLPVSLADTSLPSIEPPLVTWSREIASGETLDVVLSDAGLDASDRAAIALAIGAEYDLRRLRPGHVITVVSTTDGTPRRVELAVEDGVRIETVFSAQLATRVLEPDPEMVTFAGEAAIESSVFAALDKAGIPARFAVDMAQMLGGTVDFRRELSGGETMRILWREARDGNERIGQPELAFATLDLGETVYEIVWPDDGSGEATIYVDGEVLRVFAQPVEGARLSSVFGRRTHPVYGNVRMHTGVDFAAARGTPVKATAPGRVSFIGRRGGYGRVVEIAHGSDTLTRYAHLSEVPDTLEQG